MVGWITEPGGEGNGYSKVYTIFSLSFGHNKNRDSHEGRFSFVCFSVCFDLEENRHEDV